MSMSQWLRGGLTFFGDGESPVEAFAIALDEVESQGYCFQIDLAVRALRAGLRVVEVPITFVERVHGTSKMSRAIVLEALWRVTIWGITGRGRRPRWAKRS